MPRERLEHRPDWCSVSDDLQESSVLVVEPHTVVVGRDLAQWCCSRAEVG